MAIPRLADMAALTLFHNPHMQPEDVSVPFGEGYSAPARVIQRRQRRRSRAASKISAVLKGLVTRIDYLLRYLPVHIDQRYRNGDYYMGFPRHLNPTSTPALLRRRMNILNSRRNFRRISRTRTFANPPLV